VDSAPSNAEASLAQLVGELADDAKQLLRQELALAKHEIHEEVYKTKIALMSLGVGIGIAAIGGLLLIIMLVHLLNTLAALPLWTCYGIVGGICAIVGIVLLFRGQRKIAQIEVIPGKTVETMKENIRWIKEMTKS
jgi:Putative Actinobacterial Holin-X, holin superfamily III